jgi:hypothetical protein
MYFEIGTLRYMKSSRNVMGMLNHLDTKLRLEGKMKKTLAWLRSIMKH